MHEERKIREAEYFYGEMLRTREDREPFTYNLSAFLSAARSVLQYARNEVKTKPGGQTWYDNQVTGRAVICFFKDRRDLNIHALPIEVRANIGIEVYEHIGVRLSEAVTIELFEEGRIVRRVHREFSQPEPAKEEDVPPTTIRTIYTFDD